MDYILIYILTLCHATTGFITDDQHGNVFLWSANSSTAIYQKYKNKESKVTEIPLDNLIKGQCL